MAQNLQFKTHQAPESPTIFRTLIWDNLRPSAPKGHNAAIDFPMSNRVKLWMVNLFGNNFTATFLNNTAGIDYSMDCSLQFIDKDKGTVQFDLPIVPYDHFTPETGSSVAINPWPKKYGGRTVLEKWVGATGWTTQALFYSWVTDHGGITGGTKDPWEAGSESNEISSSKGYLQERDRMIFFARFGSSDAGTPTGTLLRMAKLIEVNVICNQIRVNFGKSWDNNDFSGLTTTNTVSFGSLICLPEWI